MYTKLINFSNFHIEQHESLNIHIKSFLKEKMYIFPNMYDIFSEDCQGNTY